MGMNMGPAPMTPDGSSPQSEDTFENPHVAVCDTCGRKFNVAEFNLCITVGSDTQCWVPCTGKVKFL